jgi:3-oxoacyl-[acyl-carrier protein] reductase
MAGPALAPPPGAAIAVVGATGGIGRALVAALDAAGCRVVAMDLPGPLQDAPDDWSGDIARVPLDATDPGAVEAAFAHVSGTVPALDGLVHLAGFTRTRTPAVEVDPADWREVVEGNLDSAYLCLRSAAPLLRRGRAPSVVLTSSGLALKSTPGYGSYAAAKAGVLALMRATATELGTGCPRERGRALGGGNAVPHRGNRTARARRRLRPGGLSEDGAARRAWRSPRMSSARSCSSSARPRAT